MQGGCWKTLISGLFNNPSLPCCSDEWMRVGANLLELIIYWYETLRLADGHCYCKNCRGPAASCWGLFCFHSRRKQNYLPIPKKKTILCVLPLELDPLPTAGCFPFPSTRHRAQIGFRERELKLLSWRRMNSQPGNPAVTNITQGLFLPLPATTTLTPKDRECCTLQ